MTVRRMTHADVEAVRRARGRSTLLFLTDRCPVGCAHCSVDSRVDSPTIEDFELFEAIVAALCADPRLEVVGISGGEPFVERRGLELASARLAAAGKRQVVYTSGVWAAGARTPAWIAAVLARCSCVYLSTDGFHAARVPDERFVRAARAIAAAGAPIVVQVVDAGDAVAQARALLRRAFGERTHEHAELRPLTPLTHGRGAGVFARTARTPGHAFGPCELVASPMVRYDGLVTGCCNESVIMGGGPARLRRRTASADEVASAFGAFHRDPLLRVVGGTGLGALTELPRFADLGAAAYASNCDLCWAMLERAGAEDEPADPLLELLALATEASTGPA